MVGEPVVAHGGEIAARLCETRNCLGRCAPDLQETTIVQNPNLPWRADPHERLFHVHLEEQGPRAVLVMEECDVVWSASAADLQPKIFRLRRMELACRTVTGSDGRVAHPLPG